MHIFVPSFASYICLATHTYAQGIHMHACMYNVYISIYRLVEMHRIKYVASDTTDNQHKM